jgi:ketosteroid isomerase-like protein
VPGCNVIEVRNGKAIQGRLYSDTAALLMQIGALSLPKATAAS